MADQRPRIGELRWPLTLLQRVQSPAGTASIAESWRTVGMIWGKIENTYPSTFWGINAAQVDRPITHMIWVRWRPYLDNTYALQRTRHLPEGKFATETFRIRRIAEIDQKTWIVRLEVELETAPVS